MNFKQVVTKLELFKLCLHHGNMMGATHHAAGALFAAAGIPVIASAVGMDITATHVIVGTAIGFVAGVLPDIDHHSSNITKGKIPMLRYMGRPMGPAVGQLLSLPPRIVGVGVRATGNHRGPTHSVPFAALWSVLAAPLYAVVFALAAFVINFVLGALSGVFFEPLLGFKASIPVSEFVNWLKTGLPMIMPITMISVGLGYLSHLFCDGLTKVPIPIMWPLKFRIFLLPKPMRIQTDGEFENMIFRPAVIILALYFFVINGILPMKDDAVAKIDTGPKVTKIVKKEKPRSTVDR